MYSVIAADGNSYGPVDVDTLKLWCFEGRVTMTTTLLEATTGRVLMAADVPQLRDVLATIPSGPAAASGQGMIRQDPYQQGGALTPTSNQPPAYYSQYGTQIKTSPYMGAPASGVGAKSKSTAVVLALSLGGIGAHRFYLGYTSIGSAMLLLGLFTACIPTSIWAVVDVVLILNGSLKEANGNELV
jgi:hypothetical protein